MKMSWAQLAVNHQDVNHSAFCLLSFQLNNISCVWILCCINVWKQLCVFLSSCSWSSVTERGLAEHQTILWRWAGWLIPSALLNPVQCAKCYPVGEADWSETKVLQTQTGHYMARLLRLHLWPKLWENTLNVFDIEALCLIFNIKFCHLCMIYIKLAFLLTYRWYKVKKKSIF